jgi:hypothetical protein
MGELNDKPFRDVCLQKFSAEEWDVKCVELCSLWQEQIKKSDWYPFKKIIIEGTLQVCNQSLQSANIGSCFGHISYVFQVLLIIIAGNN